MSQPLVSVLMAARNRERFIGDAVASVLQQDYERLELIAVENASEDEALKVVKALRRAIAEQFVRTAVREPAKSNLTAARWLTAGFRQHPSTDVRFPSVFVRKRVRGAVEAVTFPSAETGR